MNRPLALSPRSDPPPLSALRQKVERPRPPPERLHDEPERRDHCEAAVLDLDGLQNRQIFVRQLEQHRTVDGILSKRADHRFWQLEGRCEGRDLAD